MSKVYKIGDKYFNLDNLNVFWYDDETDNLCLMFGEDWHNIIYIKDRFRCNYNSVKGILGVKE